MRGVSFLIPNEYNNYLWKIFINLSLSNYTWYIEQEELLYFNEKEGKVCSNLFTSDILTGAEFEKCITKNDYYIHLANIQAYPKNTKKEDILTYEDFIKSKCEMILLCADSEYVDLYSKNKEFLKKVFEMSIQNGFKNIEYITDENDERTALRL